MLDCLRSTLRLLALHWQLPPASVRERLQQQVPLREATATPPLRQSLPAVAILPLPQLRLPAHPPLHLQATPALARDCSTAEAQHCHPLVQAMLPHHHQQQ